MAGAHDASQESDIMSADSGSDDIMGSVPSSDEDAMSRDSTAGDSCAESTEGLAETRGEDAAGSLAASQGGSSTRPAGSSTRPVEGRRSSLAASLGSGWDEGPAPRPGQCLDAITDHLLRRLLRPERLPNLTACGTIRSACLCAGTGCTEWVMSSIVRAIRGCLRTAGLSHETLFFCEQSLGKRNFVRVNHGPDAMVFWDVHEMAHDQARQGRGGGSLKRVPFTLTSCSAVPPAETCRF